MVDTLSILQPLVFRGLIERFNTRQNLTLLNSVNKRTNPTNTMNWEIRSGSRNIAKPNVPNAEAHIVGKGSRRSGQATMVYLRDKKAFDFTTTNWIRQVAAGLSDLATPQAEAEIVREVQDLNDRFDNYAEFLLWKSLEGSIEIDESDVQATIDYKFSPDAFLTASTGSGGGGWETATPLQIVHDIRALKDRVTKYGATTPNVAYTSQKVLDLIVDRFAEHGDGAYLSDRMIEEFYATGFIRGFMGLNWSVQDSVYDGTGRSYEGLESNPAEETRFLNENSVIVANLDGDLDFYEGPSADWDAPAGFIGKFAKNWLSPDPTGREFLLEWHILPVHTAPDQIAQIKDVTA